MKKLITLLSMVTLMTACATDSALGEQERKLQWLKDADPQRDARQALQNGDLRMMGLPQRAIIIPGVPVEKMRQYELKCGVKLINGVSDMVRSQQHLQLMKQAHQYALQYNALIKPHCQP